MHTWDVLAEVVWVEGRHVQHHDPNPELLIWNTSLQSGENRKHVLSYVEEGLVIEPSPFPAPRRFNVEVGREVRPKFGRNVVVEGNLPAVVVSPPSSSSLSRSS
jgi:hypothetical protein